MRCFVEIRFEFEVRDVDAYSDAADIINDVLDAGTFQDVVVENMHDLRDKKVEFTSSLVTASGMIEDDAPPASEVPVEAKSNILDDDSRFVVDVLSVYGNTLANDVVPSDGIGAARRLATAIKTGTLRLVFHDDLEDLAERLLKIPGLVSVQAMPERGVDDTEWTVSISGDGWDVQARCHTLTEAMNDVIERQPEEGLSRSRLFIARCKQLEIGHHDAYALALDAGFDLSPPLWDQLWKENS